MSKTVRVAAILETANFALANPKLSNGEKRGIVGLLDSVLHATGNYAGYGWVIPSAEVTPETEYSRHYYTSRQLQDGAK